MTETNYKVLIQQNATIHTFMGRQPEVEYVVSTLDETGFVFSPKHCGYDWAPQQKAECDRFIAETKRGETYKTLRQLNYPYYNRNWNELMDVVDKIRSIGKIVSIEFLDEEVVCQIRHDAMEGIASFCVNANSGIEAVYKAILEFITWYNSTQNKGQ